VYTAIDPSTLPSVSDRSPVREPILVDGASQLFVDDHLIAFSQSVHRRLNPPRKQSTPFLTATHPWEGNSILYSCVLPHDYGYRLYYKAKN